MTNFADKPAPVKVRRAKCWGYGTKPLGKGAADRHCGFLGMPPSDVCNCEMSTVLAKEKKVFALEERPDEDFDRFYCGCFTCGWD
jgi:hypothetical protein